MNGPTTFDEATSPVLNPWAREAADVRHTATPVLVTARGTGLPMGDPSLGMVDKIRPPFAGLGAPLGAFGIDGVMGADQVMTAVRIPAAADPGIPPRRTPSRC